MYQINYIYFLLTFNIRYTRDTKLTIYIWDRIVVDPPASHACFFCVFVCSDLNFCVCSDKASVCSDANRVHCRIFPALAEYSAPGDFRVDVWFKLVGVFFWDSWCLPFDSALFYFANWKTASTDTIVTFSFVVCSHISAAPCCLAAATWQIQGGGKKKTNREDAISQKHLKNFTATSSPLYWECFVSWHSNNHHELFTLKAHSRQNEISDRAHHPL